MPRMLILMSTRTYRAEAFMKAASGLGVEVTVGTELLHMGYSIGFPANRRPDSRSR